MGLAAREYVVRHFNREQQADEFRAMLQIVAEWRKKPLYAQLKRLFDVVLSLAALLIALPVMVVIAPALLLTMGAPLLFHQHRPGLQGKPFTIHKFRTMKDVRTANGDLLPDEQR